MSILDPVYINFSKIKLYYKLFFIDPLTELPRLLILKQTSLNFLCEFACNTSALNTFLSFFPACSISQVLCLQNTLKQTQTRSQWKALTCGSLCCFHALSQAQTNWQKWQNRSEQTSWWGGDSDEHGILPWRSYLLSALLVGLLGFFVGTWSTSLRGGALRHCLRLAVRSRLGLAGIIPQVQVIVCTWSWGSCWWLTKTNPIHCSSVPVLFNPPSFVPFYLLLCFLSLDLRLVLFFLVVFRRDTHIDTHTSYLLCRLTVCLTWVCLPPWLFSLWQSCLGVTVASQTLCVPLSLSPPPLVRLLLSLSWPWRQHFHFQQGS